MEQEENVYEQKIMDFLKQHPDEEFSFSRLRDELEISFPLISKHIAVLQARGLVEIRNLAQLKLVKYKGESDGK